MSPQRRPSVAGWMTSIALAAALARTDAPALARALCAACTGPTVNIAYGTLFTALRDDVTGFTPMANGSLQFLRETSVG